MSERVGIDPRHGDAAVLMVSAFLHRLASDRPGTGEGDLALDLSADLAELVAERGRSWQRLSDDLDDGGAGCLVSDLDPADYLPDAGR